MTRIKKSTQVEFVTELRALKSAHPEKARFLERMIVEAISGEFHDYKNEKYVCGKQAASSLLRSIDCIDLAKKIEGGEFDEEADEDDKKYLLKTALEFGLSREQAAKLFGL